jgi:hypothetical protein
MGILNRNHVAETRIITRTVNWDETKGTFTIWNKATGTVPVVTPFAVDVWLAQHGYELWTKAADGRTNRSVMLASVTAPLPVKPEGNAVPIYQVPVASQELGNAHLVIKGKNATGAFCDLFESLENDLTDSSPQVPVVSVSVSNSDFGLLPTFEIVDVVARPAEWLKAIVSFAV